MINPISRRLADPRKAHSDGLSTSTQHQAPTTQASAPSLGTSQQPKEPQGSPPHLDYHRLPPSGHSSGLHNTKVRVLVNRDHSRTCPTERESAKFTHSRPSYMPGHQQGLNPEPERVDDLRRGPKSPSRSLASHRAGVTMESLTLVQRPFSGQAKQTSVHLPKRNRCTTSPQFSIN